MKFRIRQASPTDAPALMHIEHTCRTAASFLPAGLRDPGQIRPRNWRAWIQCAPPFDRNPTPRRAFLAYEPFDLMGFIAVMHDSLYAGYRADVAGLYVLPRHRREGVATALLIAAARWLQDDAIARITAACYAHDPTRSFYDRLGGFVVSSTSDDKDPTAVITYGLGNLKELAARE